MLLLGTFKAATVEAYDNPVKIQVHNRSLKKTGFNVGDTGNITQCDDSKLTLMLETSLHSLGIKLLRPTRGGAKNHRQK